MWPEERLRGERRGDGDADCATKWEALCTKFGGAGGRVADASLVGSAGYPRALMKPAAALFSVIAVLLLAAPALSLGPFRPDPVEFQVTPPSDSLQQETKGDLLSKPTRAPKRFNLVGLAWEGQNEPEIELRVRQAGEPWGPWTDVPSHRDGGPDPGSAEKSANGVSSPVWAGEADYVQYRLSKQVPNLRLKFVNASGTATAAERAKTGVVGAITGASEAVTGLLTAEADTQPTINPRSSWGASDCPPRRTPDYGEVKASFVHHTVNANNYTSSQVPAMILSICRYHRNTNGWDDIGYQFLVDKYGRLWEGRAGGINKAVVGAQAQGYNAQSTGIANLGTHTSVQVTTASLDAMARLIRWKLPLHGQPTEGSVTLTSAGGELNRYPAGTLVKVNRIPGHRDGDKTACPGDALYAQLPDLRRRSDRPPAAPRGLTASTKSNGIALDWGDNSEPDLSGYEVYRATTAGGPYSKINDSRVAGSSYTDASVSVNTAYHYIVKAADKINQLSLASNEASTTPGSAPTYRDVILSTSGLRSYWRLGESSGTAAVDEKAAYPGSYVGGVSLGQPGALTSETNTAARFDGSDDEMTAGGSGLALSTTGTVEGWFNWEGGTSLLRDTTTSGGWILAYDNGGSLAYRVGGKSFTTTRTTASVRNGWHHLALTVTGGTARLYVDGALVHTGSGAGTAAARMPWHVMRNGSYSTQFTRGAADEVALYGSALSTTTVTNHYTAGRR
jgi:hypothetical protein